MAKRPVPAPPGGELSRGMLEKLVRIWSGHSVAYTGLCVQTRGLIRRGLATTEGTETQEFPDGNFYPLVKLTLLGEQRAYWCQRGRLP